MALPDMGGMVQRAMAATLDFTPRGTGHPTGVRREQYGSTPQRLRLSWNHIDMVKEIDRVGLAVGQRVSMRSMRRPARWTR